MNHSGNIEIENLVNSVKLISGFTRDIAIGVKNLHSEHIYLSDYCRKVFKVDKDKSGLISIWPNYSLLSSIEDDQYVFTSRLAKTFIIFCNINQTLIPFLFTKSPLINPVTQEILGLIYYGIEYPYFNLHKQIAANFSAGGIEKAAQIKLTRREKEVIFFFMANCSSQEIAENIGKIYGKAISKSTIDSIFSNQLYLKFVVVSRVQLHEKLAKLGYGSIIPKSMLSDAVFKTDQFDII